MTNLEDVLDALIAGRVRTLQAWLESYRTT